MIEKVTDDELLAKFMKSNVGVDPKKRDGSAMEAFHEAVKGDQSKVLYISRRPGKEEIEIVQKFAEKHGIEFSYSEKNGIKLGAHDIKLSVEMDKELAKIGIYPQDRTPNKAVNKAVIADALKNGLNDGEMVKRAIAGGGDKIPKEVVEKAEARIKEFTKQRATEAVNVIKDSGGKQSDGAATPARATPTKPRAEKPQIA